MPVGRVERRLGRHPLGSFLLGAHLATGIIAGGVAAFAAVLTVLVTSFS